MLVTKYKMRWQLAQFCDNINPVSFMAYDWLDPAHIYSERDATSKKLTHITAFWLDHKYHISINNGHLVHINLYMLIWLIIV